MSYQFIMRGLREAQEWNLRAVRSLAPHGSSQVALRDLTVDLHRYAVTVSHRDTGALANSHRMDVDLTRFRSVIYIDPTARNPRTLERPSVYGVDEERRGGEHAFYRLTVTRRVPSALSTLGAKVGVLLT